MIKIYGMQVRVIGPGGLSITKRAEIPAGSAKEAQDYLYGWCVVQGYQAETAVFEVIADGMTFREHMARELTNAAARLSLRYGVAVVGPFDREIQYQGDEPRSIVRLELSNGWAVSLSSRLSDAFSVDTEMMTGHVVDGDDWEMEFHPDVMEYESRIMIGAEYDGEIGEIIEGLAELPRQ